MKEIYQFRRAKDSSGTYFQIEQKKKSGSLVKPKWGCKMKTTFGKIITKHYYNNSNSLQKSS